MNAQETPAWRILGTMSSVLLANLKMNHFNSRFTSTRCFNTNLIYLPPLNENFWDSLDNFWFDWSANKILYCFKSVEFCTWYSAVVFKIKHFKMNKVYVLSINGQKFSLSENLLWLILFVLLCGMKHEVPMNSRSEIFYRSSCRWNWCCGL